MNKPLILVFGCLIAWGTGCASEPDLDGEWDLTLSLVENAGPDAADSATVSYAGRLSLEQTFNRFQGSGYVLGPGGPSCKVEFLVDGEVLDESTIPIKFDFSKSVCAQDEFEADATMTLKLIDDGYVLYGHSSYVRDDLLLYASASLRLYD